jgi:mannose/fructose/N-acetylgalactosamine-specific phosphotransferase system component IIC
MTDPLVWILLGVVGVWAALDGTSVGQFMVARPLVSGVLAGTLLGDAWTGLLVGGILELLHLSYLPAGGARVAEPGPAAVPGVLAATLHAGPGGIALGVALGVLLSSLGGATVALQRRWNTRLVQGAEDGGWPRARYGRVLALCLGLDGLRAATVVGAGLAVAVAFPAAWVVRWPLPTWETVALCLMAGFLAVGVLATGTSPGGRRRGAAILALGLTAGLAMGLLAW